MGGEQPNGRGAAPRLAMHAAPIAGTLWSIDVEGPLAPGWAGDLAAGLASRGIDIERGHALGDDTGLWSGRFEVRVPAGFAAMDLDVAALAALSVHETSPQDFAQLALDDFSLDAASAHGGSLRLRIAAPDRVGFLAALLRRLAYFTLFPIELHLDTQRGRIADELWLRGAAHRAPSAAIADALRRALEATVAPAR